MPELISEQAGLLSYGGVNSDQYEEVRRRLTRLNSGGVNWFCQRAHLTWTNGLMTVWFTLSDHATASEVKDVIVRAFSDINFVKGIAS